MRHFKTTAAKDMTNDQKAPTGAGLKLPDGDVILVEGAPNAATAKSEAAKAAGVDRDDLEPVRVWRVER